LRPIYLDHSATTPMLPEVWEAMQPYAFETYGNPASAHQAGRHARRAQEDARERTAALLGAQPDEIIFTSGATEANNTLPRPVSWSASYRSMRRVWFTWMPSPIGCGRRPAW
jgi:cysteine sulfinate desulfinase/cysteine desulfurase-like protein